MKQQQQHSKTRTVTDLTTGRGPRYLTVEDVMAIVQCGRSYAYELIERVGRANTPGLARVLESKVYAYLEGRHSERPPVGAPLSARPTSSFPGDRSTSVVVPYTPPPRKLRCPRPAARAVMLGTRKEARE